ncbi:MAG: hypothetical protein ACLGJC_28375, partial [Alphaproteobacteria bacterium]
PSLAVVAAALGKSRPVLAWAAGAIREVEGRLNLSLAGRGNNLIVVDNLDRATVAQQRAVLRALDKHRDDLEIPFVVVMDDTALRTGSNDPEPPAELFRKVVELEIHMPARGIVQTARIVGTMADELALADGLWTRRRLRGDLARLFTLLPSPVSPRTIARFLNDLCSRCRQHGLDQPEDIAAMARVLAIGQVLPPLRADQHRMVEALAANDIGKLERLWDSLTGGGRGPLPVDAARLFHLTRHLIPHNGDWQRILAPAAQPQPAKAEARAPVGDAGASTLPMSAEHLLARRRLVRRLSEVLPRVMGGFGSWDWRNPRADESRTADRSRDLPQLSADEIADAAWPVMEAFFAAANSATERLRLFDYVRETLRETLGADLRRVWLGDAEVLSAMHPSARTALLREVIDGGREPALLLAMPPEHLPFYDRILIVTAAGFGAPDRHSVAPWLGHRGTESEPLGLIRPSAMHSPSAVVEAGWPPFQSEDRSIEDPMAREELAWHFRTLKALHDRMIPVFPASLAQALLGRRWLPHQANAQPLAVLEALSHLVTRGAVAEFYLAGAPGAWNAEVLKIFATGREEAFQDVVRAIAQPAAVIHNARPPMVWFALFLAVTFAEGNEGKARCREWWNALARGAAPVCADPWFMEVLLRPPYPLPIEDADVVKAPVIDALFGKALAGFNLSIPNPDVEEQIVGPLRVRLLRRTDAARWGEGKPHAAASQPAEIKEDRCGHRPEADANEGIGISA